MKRGALALLLGCLSVPALAADETDSDQAGSAEGGSGDGQTLEETLETIQLPQGLTLYKPNYALPITWTDDANDEGDAEFKYQISLQYQMLDTPVYVAYTQTAYFRWLDEDDSRPFREINHKPEAWYRFRPGRLKPEWLGLDIGIEHQSNGEDQPESRSWNRAYIRPFFERGAWRGSAKIWARVGAPDEPSSASNPDGDDNPDITEFYGHHSLRLEYTFDDGDRLSAMTRYAFEEQRGALRVEYATPTGGGSGYWYAQLFSGYGESLETFRENRTRIGIGFALLN